MESTGTIRCGNSKLPSFSVVGHDGWIVGGAPVGEAPQTVSVTVTTLTEVTAGGEGAPVDAEGGGGEGKALHWSASKVISTQFETSLGGGLT